MSRAVFLRSLDECFSNRLIVALLAVMLIFPLSLAVSVETLGLDELAIWFTLILGAGAIGRDLTSGALALALTRPLLRRDYVLAKWAAIVAAAGLVTLLQLGLEAGIMAWYYPRAFDLLSNQPLHAAFTRLSLCAGVGAVLVLLSTLVSGQGNVILFGLCFAAAQVLQGQGASLKLPWVSRVGQELAGALLPRLNAIDVFRSSPPSWYAILTWLSTVCLALCGAVLVLNHRDPYIRIFSGRTPTSMLSDALAAAAGMRTTASSASRTAT